MSADHLQPSRDEILNAGLEWLYEIQQPEGAIVVPNGTALFADDKMSYRFVPAGANGKPCVVISITDKEARLSTEELARLVVELRALGSEATGLPWTEDFKTGAVELAKQAHPSLLDAVRRYRAGCPRHDKAIHREGDGCRWYGESRALLIEPKILRLCCYQSGGSCETPPEYCDSEAEEGSEYCTLHEEQIAKLDALLEAEQL